MSFQDKVVIVTGASSGIGAAIAILFSKEGANVVMVGRNQTKLDNVAKQCAKPPFVINADVSKTEEGKRIVDETVKKFGKLDILVNNAGMVKQCSVIDGNMLEVYDTIFSVNLRAVVNITTLATPHIIQTKGNIINISSVGSMMVPRPGSSLAYSMSKTALDLFTKGVALELSSSGVRVNSVNPGPVYTDVFQNAGVNVSFDSLAPMMPLKRVSQPEEIADLVAFLASDRARGITGSIYVSDNGMALQ